MLHTIIYVTKETCLHRLSEKCIFRKTTGRGDQIDPPDFLGLKSLKQLYLILTKAVYIDYINLLIHILLYLTVHPIFDNNLVSGRSSQSCVYFKYCQSCLTINLYYKKSIT